MAMPELVQANMQPRDLTLVKASNRSLRARCRRLTQLPEVVNFDCNYHKLTMSDDILILLLAIGPDCYRWRNVARLTPGNHWIRLTESGNLFSQQRTPVTFNTVQVG